MTQTTGNPDKRELEEEENHFKFNQIEQLKPKGNLSQEKHPPAHFDFGVFSGSNPRSPLDLSRNFLTEVRPLPEMPPKPERR